MTEKVSHDVSHEHLKSVVHRRGPLSKADYSEAIGDLKRARMQDRIVHICCSVCEDTGHTAESCDHNPLRLARLWSEATSVWCCYHCGYVATKDAEARAHFGVNDQDDPACKKQALHYLGAIRERLKRMYALNPKDARLREQVSDEIDWIDVTLEQLNTLQRPEGGQ